MGDGDQGGAMEDGFCYRHNRMKTNVLQCFSDHHNIDWFSR